MKEIATNKEITTIATVSTVIVEDSGEEKKGGGGEDGVEGKKEDGGEEGGEEGKKEEGGAPAGVVAYGNSPSRSALLLIERSLYGMNKQVAENNRHHTKMFQDLKHLKQQYNHFCNKAKKDRDTHDGMRHTMEIMKKQVETE